MARGGSRPGAGRKQSSLTKRTRAIAEAVLADGMTPLEVMLKAMRISADAGKWTDAASVAKDAAPYIHPRLAAVQHTGKDEGPIEIATSHTTALEFIEGEMVRLAAREAAAGDPEEDAAETD